jgi:DNA helicase-2/ATP-dependent DNA helicase PcrA
LTPNAQQLEVIRHVNGPCLVTAVPGSGKTASLTERIKYMVKGGVPPYLILAITFTNKAAAEMRERIGKAVGAEAIGKMVVCTFHSLCARMLRQNADRVGLARNFSIFDRDDQERVLKRAFCDVLDLEKNGDIESDDFDRIMSYLEKTRNACISDGDMTLLSEPWMYRVVESYYESLGKSNATDFTGLLSNTLKLLEENPDVLDRYQRRFRWISVDEVQDTNIAQYKILSLLARKYKNIMLIGDVDQSIYGFRNSRPENLFRFEEEFGAKVMKLETNYRSTPQILEQAQALIEHNSMRRRTTLRTGNPDGRPPGVIESNTDEDMAAMISSFVRTRISSGTPPSEIAILYRIKSATRVLELALREDGVKYKVIGGRSFYERKEVKTCLSILRMLSNEGDAIAFDRCVEFCCRGVGGKTVSKVLAQVGSEGVMQAARSYSRGKSRTAAGLRGLVEALDSARSMPPGEALMHVAQKTAFWSKMASDRNVQEDRCGNIAEVARDVERYVAQGQGYTLDRYIQDVSLMASEDEESDGESVNLMTIHASKGLEFDVVVVSHVNDGILPHRNSLGIHDSERREREIEEERRLLYVAMTRARKHLRLACCRLCFKRAYMPSRFLDDVNL